MKTAATTQTRRTPGAIIMTPAEYETYRPQIPASWYQAAGYFRHHKKSLEKHLKTIRKEWDEWHKKNEREWKKYEKRIQAKINK